MAVEVELKGLAECLERLHSMPPKIQKVWMRKASRAGGTPFLKAVRRLAPRKNNHLKRTMAMLFRTYSGTVVAVVGQQRKGKKFAAKKRKLKSGGISARGEAVPLHLVESRVKPHKIRGWVATASTGKKRLYPLAIRGKRNRVRFVQRVDHPGHPGRNFVRAAAEEAKSEAADAFEKRLAEEVLANADKPGTGSGEVSDSQGEASED